MKSKMNKQDYDKENPKDQNGPSIPPLFAHNSQVSLSTDFPNHSICDFGDKEDHAIEMYFGQCSEIDG